MLREIWAGPPSPGKPGMFEKGQAGPQGAGMTGPTEAPQPVSGVWFPSPAVSLGLTFLTPQWAPTTPGLVWMSTNLS